MTKPIEQLKSWFRSLNPASTPKPTPSPNPEQNSIDRSETGLYHAPLHGSDDFRNLDSFAQIQSPRTWESPIGHQYNRNSEASHIRQQSDLVKLAIGQLKQAEEVTRAQGRAWQSKS